MDSNDKLSAAISSAGEAFGKTLVSFPKLKFPMHSSKKNQECNEINQFFYGLSGLSFVVPK
ncbi:hypothetical protein ABND49_20085 [Paenibacillus larvae]